MARRYVAGFCQACDLEELCDLAALLTSEVVTNAVVHGSGRVEVRPTLREHGLRVEVGDANPTPPARLQAGVGEEHGRGVALVDSLAGSWGVRPGAGGGKVVWFEVG